MRKEIISGVLIFLLVVAVLYFRPQREVSRGLHRAGPTPGIYMHDIELQKRTLMISSKDAFGPAIWKTIVVWEDWRNCVNKPWNTDIYGRDIYGGKEFSICTNPFSQENPAIYENIVVWEDSRNGNWDIYGYDLETQQEFQITEDGADQIHPAIWGNFVVWQDERFGPWRIFVYDIARKTEFPISQDYDTIKRTPKIFWNWEENPVISENIIVWTDEIVKSRMNIIAFDLSSQRKNIISDSDSYKENPDMCGNNVVWQENMDIRGYNMKTRKEFRITEDEYDQVNPHIWGNIVVWADSRNIENLSDIYGFDILDNNEFQITNYYGDKSDLTIYGNIILWSDTTWLIRTASSVSPRRHHFLCFLTPV